MRNDLIERGYDAILIESRSFTLSNGIEFKDGEITILFNNDAINIIDVIKQ